MAESVDALVSNTSGAIRAGSTPAQGTKEEQSDLFLFLYMWKMQQSVDAPVACFIGTSGAIRAGSTPAQGTKEEQSDLFLFLYMWKMQ